MSAELRARGQAGQGGTGRLSLNPLVGGGQGDNTRRVSPVPEGLSPEDNDGLAEPTAEQVRAGIASQTCPWCRATRNDKGRPIRLLANHTNHAHGIDRLQLREAAGLTPDATGLCDPELTAFRIEYNSRPEYAAAHRGDNLCPRCKKRPRVGANNKFCRPCRRVYNRDWMRAFRARASAEGAAA